MVALATESGLQAHPLIFYELRTLNAKHDRKHDALRGKEARMRNKKLTKDSRDWPPMPEKVVVPPPPKKSEKQGG